MCHSYNTNGQRSSLGYFSFAKESTALQTKPSWSTIRTVPSSACASCVLFLIYFPMRSEFTWHSFCWEQHWQSAYLYFIHICFNWKLQMLESYLPTNLYPHFNTMKTVIILHEFKILLVILFWRKCNSKLATLTFWFYSNISASLKNKEMWDPYLQSTAVWKNWTTKSFMIESSSRLHFCITIDLPDNQFESWTPFFP